MSVFTSKFYSAEEKTKYTQMVASRLGRTPDSVVLQLTEIPTATSEIITRLATPSTKLDPTPVAPPSIAETQTTLMETIAAALSDLKLPPPAQLLSYDVITSTNDRFGLRLVYLSERDIGEDAKKLLVYDLKKRLQVPNASIQFERVALKPGVLIFDLQQADLKSANRQLLDRVGTILQQQPNLKLAIAVRQEPSGTLEVNQKREQNVRQYFTSVWKINRDRLSFTSEKPVNSGELATLSLQYRFN
jgi:hypothetical protein